jgi:hypothetical protein
MTLAKVEHENTWHTYFFMPTIDKGSKGLAKDINGLQLV